MHEVKDGQKSKTEPSTQALGLWCGVVWLFGGGLALSNQSILSLSQTDLELGRRVQRLIVSLQPWKQLNCVRSLASGPSD